MLANSGVTTLPMNKMVSSTSLITSGFFRKRCGLVGGWTNVEPTHFSKILGIFPQIGVNILKYVQPPNLVLMNGFCVRAKWWHVQWCRSNMLRFCDSWMLGISHGFPTNIPTCPGPWWWWMIQWWWMFIPWDFPGPPTITKLNDVGLWWKVRKLDGQMSHQKMWKREAF